MPRPRTITASLCLAVIVFAHPVQADGPEADRGIDPAPQSAEAILRNIAAAYVEPKRARVEALAPTLEDVVVAACHAAAPEALVSRMERGPRTLETRLALVPSPVVVVPADGPGQLSADDLPVLRTPALVGAVFQGIVEADPSPLPVGSLAGGLLPASCFVYPESRVHRVTYEMLAVRASDGRGSPAPPLRALLLETPARWYVLDTLGTDDWERALGRHTRRLEPAWKKTIESVLGIGWVADRPFSPADAALFVSTFQPPGGRVDGRHPRDWSWPRGPDAPSRHWSFVLLRPDGVVFGDADGAVQGPGSGTPTIPLTRDPIACHRSMCAPDESCTAPSVCHDLEAVTQALKERRQGHRVVVAADASVEFALVERAIRILLGGGNPPLVDDGVEVMLGIGGAEREVAFVVDAAAGPGRGHWVLRP